MKKWIWLLLTGLVLSGCGQKEEIETVTEVAVEEGEMDTVEIQEDILSWDEKSITIGGLQQEYEVWFMSDLHMTLVNEDESEEIVQYANERTPGFKNEANVSSDEILSP